LETQEESQLFPRAGNCLRPKFANFAPYMIGSKRFRGALLSSGAVLILY
jgi:hypothetical protein